MTLSPDGLACIIRLSSYIRNHLFHHQTEVLLSWDYTDGVGVALATAPTLNTDNRVTLVNDTQLESVGDTPLEASVNILLPDLDVEVRLLLREVEGVDTAVQVGILYDG